MKNSEFGPNDKEIIGIVEQIVRTADNHDAVEIVLSPSPEKTASFVKFRVGEKWISFPNVPGPFQEAVLRRFLILTNLPSSPETIEPGIFPYNGSASFKLATRRRSAYARLFKEHGRFILHLNLVSARVQEFFNAIEENNVELVREMAGDGMDVNVQDFRGNTPLIEAVSRRHLPVAEALLELGAYVNVRNDFGMTALMMAYSQPSLIDLLLRHGADPNLRDNEGRNVLFIAMIKLQAKAVSLLIERGAYVNVLGPGPQPLIETAANTMPDEVVQMMLDRGAEGYRVPQQPSNKARQPPPANERSAS